MSDFDEVLERLVTDASFQAALRADPESALHGYRLDPAERELLAARLDVGAGTDHAVEDRITKSGLFGMVGPVVSALGFVATPGDGTGVPSAGKGAGQFGPAVDGAGVLGRVPTDAAGVVHTTFEAGGAAGILEVGGSGEPGAGTPAEDYQTRVDADGDGRWDPYLAVERGDGGVEILVDRDGDGTVDWVGHDDDRDGLVDSADVDLDHDGHFEARFVDDTGDGWLDRRL